MQGEEMTSPSADSLGPWEAGFAGPGLPDLEGGALIIAAELPEAGTGIAVTYTGGVFRRQFWTDGPPVPLIIELLTSGELKVLRDQLAAQLQGPGSGLDEIPLRAFLEAVRLHLSPGTSDRFAAAVFGTITAPNPGEFLGQISWPGDVTGTVQASANGISAQTGLAHLTAASLVPLRPADVRSLVAALQAAPVSAPWDQVLNFAEQAL
jgi:hypothetical protein